MTMPYVHPRKCHVVWLPEHDAQPVKNLGWLLRNARYVDRIRGSRTNYGGKLYADGTRNGRAFTFICDFADFGIMCRWTRRPSLTHTANMLPRNP